MKLCGIVFYSVMALMLATAITLAGVGLTLLSMASVGHLYLLVFAVPVLILGLRLAYNVCINARDDIRVLLIS